MMCLPKPRRDAARLRPALGGLESLEDRRLLSASNGGQWTYANRITYSFMPDGTSVGGTPSKLFQTLNAVAPTATWQLQFQKAAAVWGAVANLNIAQVGDDGSPVGGAGYQQGDSRYGDIRIGAIPQSTGILGYALSPPPINGGSDAGDIVLNSAIAWRINSDFDLQTVAIHEIGHALGMAHSAISSAVMYAYYTSMKQGLTSDDVAGIRGIYGPNPTDTTNNATAAAAIDLTPMLNGLSQLTADGQYIASATSFEWYKVTVPASTSGSMTVVMQSSGLSSLSPRLAVYNSAMAAVGQSVSPNSYGSTETFTVGGVLPGQVYYVRASAANTGPSAVGAFALQVNLGSTPLPAVSPPNTTVLAQPDLGVGLYYDTAPADRLPALGRLYAYLGELQQKGWTWDDLRDLLRGLSNPVQIGELRTVGDALRVSDLSPDGHADGSPDGQQPDQTTRIDLQQDLAGHVATHIAGADGSATAVAPAPDGHGTIAGEAGSLDGALAGWRGVHRGRARAFHHWLF